MIGYYLASNAGVSGERGEEGEAANRRAKVGGDDSTSVVSLWSTTSFEECLKEGEERLREEVHRFYGEQQEQRKTITVRRAMIRCSKLYYACNYIILQFCLLNILSVIS